MRGTNCSREFPFLQNFLRKLWFQPFMCVQFCFSQEPGRSLHPAESGRLRAHLEVRKVPFVPVLDSLGVPGVLGVTRENGAGHHQFPGKLAIMSVRDHMVPAAGIPPASSSLPGPTLEGRGMGLRQCQDSKHFLQTTQQKTPFSIFVENCRIRPFSNICC